MNVTPKHTHTHTRTQVYGKYYSRLSKKVQAELAAANGVAEEVLSTMTTVKAHAAQVCVWGGGVCVGGACVCMCVWRCFGWRVRARCCFTVLT